MTLLIDNTNTEEIQGVRSILSARSDVVSDAMVLSDVNLKVAELALLNALRDCPGFSRADIIALKERLARTELPENDPDYVAIEDYENEFGCSYEDDLNNLCLLRLALQYKLAGLIVSRQPQLKRARVLGAEYEYSDGQIGLRGQQIDDAFDDIIDQLCGGRGKATASVRVASPRLCW